jgi:aspartate-semialdehyde dehydrogenase
MVGEIMLKVLAERNFPVTELIPVASERSVGKKLILKVKIYCCGLQTAVDMKADIALFSAWRNFFEWGSKNAALNYCY